MKVFWEVLGFIWAVLLVFLSYVWRATVITLTLLFAFIKGMFDATADLMWGSLIYDITGFPPDRRDD